MLKRSPIVLLAGVIGLLVVAGVGWYLISPLFIDEVVDEDFPAIPSAAELAEMSEEEKAAVEEDVMEEAADMPDKMMEEEMPSGEPMALAQGMFVDADSVHQGSGEATIYELADGKHLLRFEEFDVTNGPDLHVLLATSAAPTSSSDLGEYIDLGSLKGNQGNQNYEIPADADVSQYQSIVIYCMPFHVVFSTATLQ